MDNKKLTTEETFTLAVQNQQKNNFQVAEKLYKETLKSNPNHVDAHNNLGIILQELDRINEAKKYFEKSLNLDPNNKKACKGYGNILFKLNQHSKALAYIGKGSGFIRFTQKDVKII